MLNIYLVRHGQKIDDNSGLTADGKKQVKLLLKKVKKYNISTIYSSDLERCKETAKILSRGLKLPVSHTSALREVKKEVKNNPEEHPKEIVPMRKFWEKLITEKGNILVVSSGNVNRILLGFALDIHPAHANFIQHPTGLNFIKKYTINGITHIRILCINDTGHLPDSLRRNKEYESFLKKYGLND